MGTMSIMLFFWYSEEIVYRPHAACIYCTTGRTVPRTENIEPACRKRPLSFMIFTSRGFFYRFDKQPL